MKNPQIDILKNIVSIYANTPPTPIENLWKIETAMLQPEFDNADNFYCCEIEEINLNPLRKCRKVWEDQASQQEISWRIAITAHMVNIGKPAAKELLRDLSSFEKINVDMPPHYFSREVERFFKLFTKTICNISDVPIINNSSIFEYVQDAFFDVYRIHCFEPLTQKTICPCTFAKMDVLTAKGLITPADKCEDATWKGSPLPCLECDHLFYNSILDDLSAGSYKILYSSGLPDKYHKEHSEDVIMGPKGLQKHIYDEHTTNDTAFPLFLAGMPANALIDFLTSEPEAHRKIKRCTFCGKIFFAKDAKRSKCYQKSCEQAFQRQKKATQRENNPVKYL